jgi:hypothetical protein
MKIPPHPTDKKMVVALLKIIIHEYLFVFFLNYKYQGISKQILSL